MDIEFVGRESELAAAEALLDRTRAGSSQPQLIMGEPGSGKTTQLTMVVDRAKRQGFRCIVATADPTDFGVGYAPLRMALTPALESEDSPDLTDVARTLRNTFRSGGQPDRSLEPSRVPDLLRRLLVGWASQQPVLLAVDDLHAADPDTVAVVIFLTRHLRGTGVFVCTTTRLDPDLDPTSLDTFKHIEAEGMVDVLELGAFDEAELTQLVEARVGATPDRHLLAAICDRTGGNPFFAVEFLRALAADGALVQTDHRVSIDAPTTTDLRVPRGLRTSVLHRVFRLGGDAPKVAERAAVLGYIPRDRVPLLSALTSLDRVRSDAAFDLLVRARILIGDGNGFRFAHPIVRESLYESMGPATRQRLHDRVAKILASSRVASGAPSIVEIANHARLGATAPDAEAAALLIEAGDAAAGNAPRSAAAWYRDALALLPRDDPAAVEVQLKLSRVLGLSAQHREAERIAMAVVEAQPDGPERARAVMLAARSLRWSDRDNDAARLLDQALAVPAMRLSPLLLRRAHVAIWRDEFDVAARQLAEARGLGVAEADRTLADAIAMHLHLAPGEYDDAFEIASRIRNGIARTDPATRADVLLSLLASASATGDPREAVAYADQLELTHTMPDWSDALLAWAFYRLGRWDDAARVAQRALSSVDPADEPNLAAVGVLTAVRAEQGDFVAAAAAREIGAGVGGNRRLADWADGLLDMYQDQYDVARRHLEQVVQRYRERGRINLTFPLALQAEAAWRSGDHAAARVINAEIQARPRHAGAVAHAVSRLTMQALVHRDAAAAEAAHAYATEHELAADAARALGLLGAIRDDVGHLVEAYRALGELGAVMRQRDVVHHLRRLGKRPPRQPRRSSELTRGELELASLVAQGLTNRQIARATRLSHRTVEVYLSRIYDKTGSRSRVELAMAMKDGRLAAADPSQRHDRPPRT